jgi:hypothetical protein
MYYIVVALSTGIKNPSFRGKSELVKGNPKKG